MDNNSVSLKNESNSLERIDLNIENIYRNSKLSTIAEYFMFDKWYGNWWNDNIYIYDNNEGDRCAIEFGNEYIIGVFFDHETYEDTPLEIFLKQVPEDIGEKAKKGVLQYMLLDDDNPVISTMFFGKNNEFYSTHQKEEFIKKGGRLIKEYEYSKMLEELKDDMGCTDEDLKVIEEIYNKTIKSDNQIINLDEVTIKSMHKSITKKRIEAFRDINIKIDECYLTPEPIDTVKVKEKRYKMFQWSFMVGITIFFIIFSVVVAIIR